MTTEEIKIWAENNFKESDLSRHVQDSMGNYDDVFYDGEYKGYARAIADLLTLITGVVYDNPTREDCW